SRICLIDGNAGQLSYRGYPIDQLAEHSDFEEVAYLLLKGKLPNREELDHFKAEQRQHRRLKFRIIEMLKKLPDGGHPMDALCASVAAIGMYYPQTIVEDPEARWGAAIRLM